jgi:hypothetical protein
VHASGISGTVVVMPEGHLDRQPPRDEAEEREQERIIEASADVGDADPPTSAPADDIAEDAGRTEP